MTNDPLPLVGDGELPVQPVAWYAFKHNRGNGQVAWTFHTPEESRTAYRDTCLEIAPLYAAPVGQPAPDLAGVLEALEESKRRIGLMCSEGRPPRMSIPVRDDDDDMFITDAINAAITSLRARMGKPT